MKIQYKGYTIQNEKTYYRVSSQEDPEDSWTEDTVEEAKKAIIWELIAKGENI